VQSLKDGVKLTSQEGGQRKRVRGCQQRKRAGFGGMNKECDEYLCHIVGWGEEIIRGRGDGRRTLLQGIGTNALAGGGKLDAKETSGSLRVSRNGNGMSR